MHRKCLKQVSTLFHPNQRTLMHKNVYFIFSLLLCLFLANPTYTQAQDQPYFKIFSFEKMTDTRAHSGRPWLGFIDHANMFVGLYELKDSAVDEQKPHSLDEVYYIIDGKATMEVGDQSFPVKEGAIVYVKAGETHRFTNLQDSVSAIVFFSKTDPSNSRNDPKVFVDSVAAISSSLAKLPYTSWKLLLRTSTLDATYMGESKGDRDLSRLDFPSDQLYIVLKGVCDLQVEGMRKPVQTGSIIYIKGGTPHGFDGQDSTVELLVLRPKS